MRLAHPEFDFLAECNENQAIVLTVEHKPFFVRIIQEIQNQIETSDGEFVLSELYEPLPFDKTAYLISDLFTLDFNHRKIVSKIYSELSERASDSELFTDTAQISADLERYVVNLIEQSDYHLVYSLPEVKDLFKLFHIGVCDRSESLLERLTDYISLMNDAFSIKCFFIVHLHSFFSDEDLEELYRFSFYRKLTIISLESNVSRQLECEKQYIIDNDLCSIIP